MYLCLQTFWHIQLCDRDLQFNRITQLPSGVFKDLGSLQKLWISSSYWFIIFFLVDQNTLTCLSYSQVPWLQSDFAVTSRDFLWNGCSKVPVSKLPLVLVAKKYYQVTDVLWTGALLKTLWVATRPSVLHVRLRQVVAWDLVWVYKVCCGDIINAARPCCHAMSSGMAHCVLKV